MSSTIICNYNVMPISPYLFVFPQYSTTKRKLRDSKSSPVYYHASLINRKWLSIYWHLIGHQLSCPVTGNNHRPGQTSWFNYSSHSATEETQETGQSPNECVGPPRRTMRQMKRKLIFTPNIVLLVAHSNHSVNKVKQRAHDHYNWPPTPNEGVPEHG